MILDWIDAIPLFTNVVQKSSIKDSFSASPYDHFDWLLEL